jgi:hypothetical protein
MATARPPKSILKKSAYSAQTTKSKAERDRETALFHANLIQKQKDTELTILLSTETLIDYPLAASPYNASSPSPSDAASFKAYLRLFQPSDYDALIEERNINEHCGYTLCSNPRLRDKSGGKYRILGTGGKAKDFRVVETKDLEKWCSDGCARRALYVRVQLSECPAWERGAMESNIDIDLLDEPKDEDVAMAEGLEGLSLQDKQQDAKDLALERGDGGRAIKTGMVDVVIQEKEVRRPPEAPSLGDDELSGRLDTMHLTLEGYTSKFTGRRQQDFKMEDDDDNDDNRDDWMI